MKSHPVRTRSTAFRAGWIALLSISALATIAYGISIFVVREEATIVLGWGAYTLYAFVVLYGPFRRGERWAWYATWILVVGFAAPIFLTTESYAVWDLGAAVVMALAMLLTRPVFFPREPRANRIR